MPIEAPQPRRTARRRWVAVVVVTSIIILLVPVWLPAIGGFLVVSDPIERADALVVLAGDEKQERISYGAQLFQEGFASWYLVTDMQMPVADSEGRYAAGAKREAIRRGVPEERILITPTTVATTYEELEAIREFIVDRGFSSAILVTSPYHTRRTDWIADQVFENTNVIVMVTPLASHPYEAHNWWSDSVSRRQTAMEYAKIVGHLLGCRHRDCIP